MAPRLSFTLEPSLFRCARALRGVYEAGCGSSGRHHSTQFENKDMSSQQLPSIRDLFPDHFPPKDPSATNQSATHVDDGNPNDDPNYAKRKYVCTTCGKRFQRPSSLEQHINTHTGEKPHICPFPGCNKGFSTKSNMKRHAAGHAEESYPAASSSQQQGASASSSSTTPSASANQAAPAYLHPSQSTSSSRR